MSTPTLSFTSPPPGPPPNFGHLYFYFHILKVELYSNFFKKKYYKGDNTGYKK